jgi:hypothetical protein
MRQSQGEGVFRAHTTQRAQHTHTHHAARHFCLGVAVAAQNLHKLMCSYIYINKASLDQKNTFHNTQQQQPPFFSKTVL